MNEELTKALLAARKRHNEASGRLLAQIAARAGYEIDRTQVNHILAGTYRSRPSRKTVNAVAFLAGLDADELYQAASLPAIGPSFIDELPPEVDALTPFQRRLVLYLMRAFLQENHREAEARSGRVMPSRLESDQTDDSEFYPIAAHKPPSGQEPSAGHP